MKFTAVLERRLAIDEHAVRDDEGRATSDVLRVDGEADLERGGPARLEASADEALVGVLTARCRQDAHTAVDAVLERDDWRIGGECRSRQSRRDVLQPDRQHEERRGQDDQSSLRARKKRYRAPR
jgi:hypothetical protein